MEWVQHRAGRETEYYRELLDRPEAGAPVGIKLRRLKRMDRELFDPRQRVNNYNRICTIRDQPIGIPFYTLLVEIHGMLRELERIAGLLDDRDMNLNTTMLIFDFILFFQPYEINDIDEAADLFPILERAHNIAQEIAAEYFPGGVDDIDDPSRRALFQDVNTIGYMLKVYSRGIVIRNIFYFCSNTDVTHDGRVIVTDEIRDFYFAHPIETKFARPIPNSDVYIGDFIYHRPCCRRVPNDMPIRVPVPRE